MVGAGWAGLTVALELAAAGQPVTLLEARSVPGGRARSINRDGQEFDNGQHLLVGACTETLRQMAHVGVDPEAALLTLPFGLRLVAHPDAQGYPQSFQLAPQGAGTFALFWGLWRSMAGLNGWTRLRAIAGIAGLLRVPAPLAASVADWVSAGRQPPRLLNCLWEPLCLAVMNSPMALANARLFQNVLQQTLSQGADAARLLIPQRSLGALFPEPAVARLQDLGGKVHLRTRVQHIELEANGHWRLQLRTGESVTGARLILATAPNATLRLLPNLPELRDLRERLTALQPASICTVYLRYRQPVNGLPGLTGLLGQLGQWVVPAPGTHGRDWLAVVISAAETFSLPPGAELWSSVANELAATCPGLGLPVTGFSICERHATWQIPNSASPGSGFLDSIPQSASPPSLSPPSINPLGQSPPDPSQLSASYLGSNPLHTRPLSASPSHPHPPDLEPSISGSHHFGPETPVPGLYLAGDYCTTELPATLEAAVQSGLRAAAAILKRTS